jgi:hypothetical protein
MKQMDFFARQGADPQPYGYTARGCNAAWRKKTPFHVLLFSVRDTRVHAPWHCSLLPSSSCTCSIRARIVADGAQLAGIDFLHFHGGIL